MAGYSFFSNSNPLMGGKSGATNSSTTTIPYQRNGFSFVAPTSTGVTDAGNGVRTISMNPYDVAIREVESKRGLKFTPNPTDITTYENPMARGWGWDATTEIPQWLVDVAKPLAGRDGFHLGGIGTLGINSALGAMGDTSYRVGNTIYSANHTGGFALDDNTDIARRFDPNSFISYENSPLYRQAAGSGRWSLLNGTPYNTLDNIGKITGTKKFYGLEDSDNLDLTMAMIVGGALGGMGMTAANAGVGTSGLSAAGGEAAGYGSTALPASATTGATGVGAAGAGTAGATTGTTAGATGATEPVASVAGTGATTGSSGLTGTLSDLVTKLGGANLGTLKKAYTAYQLYNAFTGGKGGGTTGSTTGNTNSNGFSMNDLFGLIGGGMDAYNQNKAADTMRQWLDANQAKMEGFMNPNSPEYNALWERMSRKDAAAGRNSQYGPRTSDFAAQVAQAKANNILNFTTGNSRAYSNALNQKASSFAGLNSALQNAFGHNNGGTNNLSSIIKLLSGMSGSGMSNEDFFNMIGDEGMPIDYGAGTADPTEEDVLDFMNRWGEL